jgi:hypothetical protein
MVVCSCCGGGSMLGSDEQDANTIINNPTIVKVFLINVFTPFSPYELYQ